MQAFAEDRAKFLQVVHGWFGEWIDCRRGFPDQLAERSRYFGRSPGVGGEWNVSSCSGQMSLRSGGKNNLPAWFFHFPVFFLSCSFFPHGLVFAIPSRRKSRSFVRHRQLCRAWMHRRGQGQTPLHRAWPGFAFLVICLKPYSRTF